MTLLRACAIAGFVTGFVTGCATAGKPDFGEQRADSGVHIVGDSGNSNPPHDGPVTTQHDAPQQAGTQTLSETTDSTDTQVAIACGDGMTYTARNSYYRVFTLSDYGISGAFNVSAVDFVVSTAAASPTLKVSVGTYSGTPGGATLTAGDISLAAHAMVTPADTDTSEHVPITTTVSGGNLIVEIDQTVAGTTTNGITFYIGANASGETKPGYISSPDCSGATTPTSMTQQAMAEADMVITVTGST